GFGALPDAWRRWLKKRTDASARPGGETFSDPRLKYGSYFGIPLEGQAIVYVYDRSDSMERGMRRGGRRIDKSRRELSRALGELRESVRFNIVAFSIKVRPWSRELRQASPANVKEARAWLRSLDPSAGTSSYDALERAFQLAGHRTSDRFWELEVETIFFLSDGEPTRRTGGFRMPLVRDDPERILSAVRRWNATGRVVVHTIGLGLARASAPRFMQSLAEQNGGRFVAFR
ncbi:MAG: VWA domain-containing protein, partial [Planctomycetota bacterium]